MGSSRQIEDRHGRQFWQRLRQRLQGWLTMAVRGLPSTPAQSPRDQSMAWGARSLAIATTLVLTWGTFSTPAQAALPAGNAITDGGALLRNALPIDNGPVRQVQADIESMADLLRAKRWSPVGAKAKNAARILTYDREALLASVRPEEQTQAAAILDDLTARVETIREAVENRDREAVWTERRQFLNALSTLEESMVQGFPYEVPAEYASLPQLKGRATIAFETSQGPITAVVDGYSAPVTAGNFVDLVQRGFYDGLKFTRAEDSYVLQFGDPEGKEEGFIDPKTGEYRAIPLEILAQGDSEPTYGVTLEDAGRYGDLPVLPFSSYGTLAMARPEPDPNGASSQVFFFLLDNELTPPGLNLLDGRYAVFGYTVDGRKDVLGKLTAGDQILSAKVISGAENLVQPAS